MGHGVTFTFSLALKVLAVQKLLENPAGIFRYLVEQLFSQFSRSGLWVADNAQIGNKLLARTSMATLRLGRARSSALRQRRD